jgi:hypothetical protein
MCRAIYMVSGGQEGICNRLLPCHCHHHCDPTTPPRGDVRVYPVIRGARGGVKGISSKHVEVEDLICMRDETRLAN